MSPKKEARAQTLSASDAHVQQNRSICILVVDDDEDIRLTFTDQLPAMGFMVCQAANDRDGWTMLEQLHQRHAHIPFAVMSTDDLRAIAPKAREYGAHGYLPKPYNFPHVQTTCCRMLGGLPAYSRFHHCST